MSLSHSSPIRLLAISGSIRRGSTNTIILRTLQERLGARAEMTLFPLNDIPPYNAELEGENLPAPVRALKHAIAQKDGLGLCSPEYHYGMSAVPTHPPTCASPPPPTIPPPAH